ncbi:GTP pyrophosphokinase [Streptococcus oriscaviae]|uniref:GTP pyrophosphokinase family protein n=1 Tax=Streptococcus oriscaviae TaxID=2781599 RepID=A0ABX7YKB8_9STRE|nr:GTP pyrophosphokinase family protein [Streptococcus oriscaviae]QUE54205.1 GTP pyrophosphokinase family protein [Streptococcus oriscaviae]
MTKSIYGPYGDYLPAIIEDLSQRIHLANQTCKQETGFKLFEHFIARVKTPESMADKCQRKGLPLTAQSALKGIRDAIGLRIICGFVDDIYKTVQVIKELEGVSVYNEKDFVFQAKPNGYRSYHLIVEIETPYEDCLGNQPGTYFAEIQIRTIAMDSWASLEHQMKYKQDIKNPERLVKELKRCADELASCDLSMQTIRNLIAESGE